ncbi:MAG: hypothetical protein WD403_12880, partial [Pirellulales bacterium]
VFFGDASSGLARIYARLGHGGELSGCKLAGRVVGPSCLYSHTLKTSVPLAEKPPPVGLSGSGRTPDLLAEAILPDPCFWTADMPFLYQVHVELRRGKELLGSVQRSLGIRPLGTRGRRLLFESSVWVPHAVDRDETPNRDWAAWRESGTAMYVHQPDEQLCDEASRVGVALLAHLEVPAEWLPGQVRALARWPAVALAVLETDADLHPSIRMEARNLLLGWPGPPATAAEPPSWADVAVCRGSDGVELARRARDCRLPVIAHRPAGWRDDLVEARRQCDQLERELAEPGDFAGYVV